MGNNLLPFIVKYNNTDKIESEVVVWAYDEETARCRVNHEGAVPSLESIICITPLNSNHSNKPISKQP